MKNDSKVYEVVDEGTVKVVHEYTFRAFYYPHQPVKTYRHYWGECQPDGTFQCHCSKAA